MDIDTNSNVKDNNNGENNLNEGVGTQANENKDERKAFKTFQTEAEYNQAVNSILRSKLPPKEEMDAFKTWKENQKTAEEKQAETEEKLRIANETIRNLKNTNAVRDAGVKQEFVKFVTSEVGAIDGDFKENLAKFLKENTQYTTTTQTVKTVGTSAKLDGNTRTEKTTNQMMNDLIRSARK